MIEHRAEYPVTLMCRVLHVARAGFYEWLRESVSNRAREDARLLNLIHPSYAASHGVYGARRVFGDLREVGERCGLHRVERRSCPRWWCSWAGASRLRSALFIAP